MDILKRTGYYVENFDFNTLQQRFEPQIREQSRVKPDITKASET
jgi:hypothetical protein